MPLLFDRATPVEGTVGVGEYDKPDPAFLETLGAAYRQENLIGSAFTQVGNNMAAGDVITPDATYNVFDDPEMKPYLDEDPSIGETIFNRAAAQARRAQIDQERRDRQTLAASGWTGTGLSMLAGIADPTVLLPGGALVRSGRVGYSALRSGLAVGLAAGAGTAVQEAGLQATQETRTAFESSVAIGGSVILGGILGAGASRLLTHAEWGRVSKQLEADLADDIPDPGAVTDTIVKRMQSAGAAAAEDLDLSDLGIGGPRAAEVVARATAAARINPGVQTMLSPSLKVREAYGRLVDNPIYTTMNMEGRSLGADVENSVKLYERGAVGEWMTSANKLYQDARKAGYLGTRAEFNQAVARAGRRDDIDPGGNEFVTRAAQEARAKIFDPLLARAKELELLPEDVKTTTAASYVTRLWNRQRLIGEETRFRQIAREYFGRMLDNAAIRQEEVQVGNKIVHSMEVDDRFSRAFQRLENVEKRLSERARVRSGKVSRVQSEENLRLDLLKDRAPADLVRSLRGADDRAGVIATAREGRAAERKLAKKPKFFEKYPALSIIKEWGGVRVGSPLDSEMRAMGVTPQTHPGLFRKEGGLGAVDNIVWAEHPVLKDNLPEGANGYVDPDALLDAVRRELAGDPMRTVDDAMEHTNAEAAIANAEEWLDKVGLGRNATVKDVRDFIKRVTAGERRIDEIDGRISRLQQEIDEFDKATDAVRNEHVISEAEARKVSEELRTLEEEISAAGDLARSSPAVSRMVDYAKARREFGKARYDQVRKTNRLEALRLVESEGRLTPELDAEMGKLEKELADIDQRVKKARAKSDKLKPMLPKQRQEIPEFVSPEDRADYLEEIVSSVFNNLTGRGAGDVPEWLVPVKRGPLKDRVFNIPDEEIEDFLENDIELVLRRYARTMAAEVELTQKFGRADMKEQFDDIVREYDELRKAAKTPEERAKLVAAEKRDIGNLQAFRDMIRGTYRAAEEGSAWSAITRAALTWNYMRLLGGQTFTSMTDAANVVGKFGMRAVMSEALPALVSGTKAARIARQDARDLGVVTDRVLQSRLASLAELQDPYRYGSRYEKFLSNASNLFSKATGLAIWNDTLRTVVSVMSQNRLLRNIEAATAGEAVDFSRIDKYESSYMAMLGIDEGMAQRIGEQFRRHGMEEEGIFGANASKWDDDVARRAWAAALNKDADRTVIMKSVADNPLWMKSNLGKLLFQFKSFALASHQRILIAGLQERPHRLAETMLFATGIGMLISYLKYVERGDFAEADRLLNNPGMWVANGLDRSGIFSIPFEFSNTAEKLGGKGFVSAAQAIAGDEDRGGSASRYASRGPWGAVLGPSAGLFEDLHILALQLGEGDLKKSGANAVLRQIPGATLPGVRSAIHIGIKPALLDATE